MALRAISHLGTTAALISGAATTAAATTEAPGAWTRTRHLAAGSKPRQTLARPTHLGPARWPADGRVGGDGATSGRPMTRPRAATAGTGGQIAGPGRRMVQADTRSRTTRQTALAGLARLPKTCGTGSACAARHPAAAEAMRAECGRACQSRTVTAQRASLPTTSWPSRPGVASRRVWPERPELREGMAQVDLGPA